MDKVDEKFMKQIKVEMILDKSGSNCKADEATQPGGAPGGTTTGCTLMYRFSIEFKRSKS